MYNAKNYTEQGGDRTHIGGALIFDEGSQVKGFPGAANQAASTAGSYTALKEDFNALLIKLKDAGVMVPDQWNLSVKSSTSASLHDMPTANTLANSGHASVAISGKKITITLDCKVNELADCDHGASWGTHKWLGFGVSTGLSSVAGIIFADTGGAQTLSAADDSEASHVGLSAGDFVLYIKAEKLIAKGGAFTLSGKGFAETEFEMVLVEDED